MRLINADDLEINFRMLAEDTWNKSTQTTWANAYEEAADMVEGFPTADVPDTNVGKWNTSIYMINGHKISVSLCSKCGKGSVDEYAYCPHCGKKMEREEEERNENELEV